MKKEITMELGRGGILIYIPFERVTDVLKPRVEFAAVQHFTGRERQVLEHLCKGLANKEIANKLHLAERTIKFHVSSLLLKVGVTSRRDLELHFAGAAMNGESK